MTFTRLRRKIRGITSGRASPQITVVGDDAQGIYGFRGDDVERSAKTDPKKGCGDRVING